MKYPINSPLLGISQGLASGSPEAISTTACCSASVITCPNCDYDRQTNSRSCAPREASTRTKLRTGVHDIIWCFRGDRSVLSNQGQFVRKELVAVALSLLENAEPCSSRVPDNPRSFARSIIDRARMSPIPRLSPPAQYSAVQPKQWVSARPDT